MRIVFLFILVVILIVIFFSNSKFDKFCNYAKKYPYNPSIQTPQTNYMDIINKIQKQDQYKKELSLALNPIPTMQCQSLYDKGTCNKFGCNWFGNMCSAMYPSYL